MTIFQLTDMHIAPDGVATNGIDVRANFLAGLRTAREWQPDALVLSGDLCFETGDESVYRWVKERLADFPVPFYVIPGNHDDASMMEQVFDLQRLANYEAGCFTAEIGGRRVLFMNSETGFFTEPQIDWLEKQLAELVENQAMIFVHYPPIRTGLRFMDENYPMQETWRMRFQSVVFRHPRPVHVFCGHYHAARSVGRKNLFVHVTPSTYFQIDPRPLTFQIDHYRPGFRWISEDGDRIQSSVHYFQGRLAPELPQ